MKYFPHIDALRAVSVFIVIFHHLPIMGGDNLFTTIFHHFTGVEIFFVISGFLITRILLLNKANNKPIKLNLKTFYIRRFFRIFPIYYLSIFYLILINPSDYRSYFWYDLFYISNFKMGFDGDFAGVTPHFWSLAVEEQFYLIWPLIIFGVSLAKNKLVKTILFVFLLGVAGKYLFDYLDKGFLAARTINSLAYLGMGGLLGYFELYKSDYISKLSKYLGYVLLSILFIAVAEFYYGIKIDRGVYFIIHLIFVTIIVSKFVTGFSGFVGKIAGSSILTYLGKISYGLYVYHFLAIHIITPINKVLQTIDLELPIAGYTGAITKVLATIVIASVSWFLIEKPINKIKNRFAYK